MTPRKLVVVGGGARSGKSAFAVSLARRLGTRRVFVATAEAGDDEMRERIARHVRARGKDFRTVEASLDLPGALRGLAEVDVVVVDCITLWLSNLLLAGHDEGGILERIDDLIGALEGSASHVVLVTNEVGMGVVPASALGRTFRDLAGRAHQQLTQVADEIYFGALGVVLRLRPGPVAVVPGGDT